MSIRKNFGKNDINDFDNSERKRLTLFNKQFLQLLTVNRRKLHFAKRRLNMRQISTFVFVEAAVLNRVQLESV